MQEKQEAPLTIKLHAAYVPIEGEVVGVVEDITETDVHYRIKDTVFIIPIERFTEYFEKAE